jgi:hypothetical protein
VAHQGLDFVGWKGWGGPGERPRRCRSALAAGLPAPACAWSGHGSGRLGQLLGGLGKVEEGCLGSRSAWNRSSPQLLCLGTGGRHGRQLGGPTRRGRGSGRFIEELSDSGQGERRGGSAGRSKYGSGSAGKSDTPACVCLGTRRGQRGVPGCLGVRARLGRVRGLGRHDLGRRAAPGGAGSDTTWRRRGAHARGARRRGAAGRKCPCAPVRTRKTPKS